MDPRTPNPRTTLLVVLTLLATLSLGACNTMRGVGKDTEAVGKSIQDEAEQHLEDDDDEGGTP
jgi:predicted small secreted protein